MLAQIRWLLRRYWPRHGASDNLSPHCGNGPGRGGILSPHCGNGHGEGGRAIGTHAPPCGEHVPTSLDCGDAELERANLALAALARTWSDTVALSRPTRAKEIARAFQRCLAAEPDLAGLCVRSEWIRAHYPIFCEWLRLGNWAPPYKDFAHELAFLMPRRRQETWRDGKRLGTCTVYFVAPLAEVQCAEMRVRKCA
jgi:hypothetical protein